MLSQLAYEVKVPWAPVPRAWTARSGTYTISRLSGTKGGGGGWTYPLMVKPLDLLTEDKVFQQSWTTLANTQTVLVFDGTADISRHIGVVVVEVVLRQKLLGGSGGIVAGGIAGVDLAGHVRTSSIGKANSAVNDGETEGAHSVQLSKCSCGCGTVEQEQNERKTEV